MEKKERGGKRKDGKTHSDRWMVLLRSSGPAFLLPQEHLKASGASTNLIIGQGTEGKGPKEDVELSQCSPEVLVTHPVKAETLLSACLRVGF